MKTAYSALLALFSVAPALRAAQGRALSVYVPARSDGYDARYYDIVFGDLRHRYRERLDPGDLDVMNRELPRLRTHVAQVRPAGCASFAAFAESATGVLEIVRLPALTEERLEVGELLLAPALRQLERFPAAVVVVVDKERAKSFGVVLDEVHPIGDVAGRPVAHSKAGWTSALSNQRKADNRARENLAAVVEQLESALGHGEYERVYVAGPVEARSQFERLLPPEVRRSAVHLAGMSLDSPHLEHDVRRHVAALRQAGAAPSR